MINGGGVLVRVPQPARFAIHKLLVSQDRPAAFQTKATKDLAQAAAVILALDELRPGDIKVALEHAKKRGRRWTQALASATKLLARHHPAATESLP